MQPAIKLGLQARAYVKTKKYHTICSTTIKKIQQIDNNCNPEFTYEWNDRTELLSAVVPTV